MSKRIINTKPLSREDAEVLAEVDGSFAFAKRPIPESAIMDLEILESKGNHVKLRTTQALTIWAESREEDEIATGRMKAFLACHLDEQRISTKSESYADRGVYPEGEAADAVQYGYRVAGRVGGLYDWQLVPGSCRVNLGFTLDVGFELLCYMESEGRFGFGLGSYLEGRGVFLVAEASKEAVQELFSLQQGPCWSFQVTSKSQVLPSKRERRELRKLYRPDVGLEP